MGVTGSLAGLAVGKVRTAYGTIWNARFCGTRRTVDIRVLNFDMNAMPSCSWTLRGPSGTPLRLRATCM